MKDDVELWMEFIKRDIPNWKEYDLPEESDCWYDVYRNLLGHVQKSVEEDAERLKMALDGINSERKKHSAKLVTDRRTARLPQVRPTAKQRYASYDRKMGGLAPKFLSAAEAGIQSADPLSAPAWTFERPQMPRSETTPTRRKNSIFSPPKRNSALAVPSKQLNNRATQVKQAPLSLIEEHRRPEPTATNTRKAPPTVIAPGRTRINNNLPGSNSTSTTPSLQEREDRLRALASGKPSNSKPTSASPAEPSTQLKGSSRNSPLTPNSPSKSMAPSLATRSVSVPSENKQATTPNNEFSNPLGGTTGNSNHVMSTTTSEQLRPMIIRKRPPPSIFIQPKKRKVA